MTQLRSRETRRACQRRHTRGPAAAYFFRQATQLGLTAAEFRSEKELNTAAEAPPSRGGYFGVLSGDARHVHYLLYDGLRAAKHLFNRPREYIALFGTVTHDFIEPSLKHASLSPLLKPATECHPEQPALPHVDNVGAGGEWKGKHLAVSAARTDSSEKRKLLTLMM